MLKHCLSALLLLTATLETASAEVDPACAERFFDGGAIPGDPMCFVNAITSTAGLGDYGCTADDGTIAREYCGIADCPAGVLVDFDTGECRQHCDFGVPDPSTGECPVVELGDYEPLESEDIADCNTNFDPNPAGPLSFVGQGLDHVSNPVLSNINNVGTALTVIDLVDASQTAQATGNSSGLFAVLYNLLFPLLPVDNAIQDAFEDFTDFTNQLNGVCR